MRKDQTMKKLICLLLSVLFLLALASCDSTVPTNETDFSSYRANGVSVPLDAEAAAILASLGTPKATAETNSCYGDGKDKVYEYASFRVETYTVKNLEYILSVTVFDDSNLSNAKTVEGIALGATRDAVIATYGTPETEDSFKLVYVNSTLKTKLQLSLSNGIVTKIEYLKSE